MSFSTEFTIDGVPYLIAANCHSNEDVGAELFKKLVDKVQKNLVTYGKHVAFPDGVEATAKLQIFICRRMVHYTLTINPKGNTFQ